MRFKFMPRTPAGSGWSSRSTRPTPQWPIRSPPGRLPRARSASGSCCETRFRPIPPTLAPTGLWPPPPAEPFADLPKLLALAAHDNIAVKISGACTLSHEKFPYKDIWDPLGRIFDAFSIHSCMWGNDWTRAVALLTYKEGVDAFRVTDRLSDADRATLMGGSLTKIYGWAPKKK